MKKIGFLSFGHWSPSPQSLTRSASDALLQSIELAVAAEELGADGAYWVARSSTDDLLRLRPDGTTTRLTGFSNAANVGPRKIAAPPPELGQHTNEVLKEFGFKPKEIAALRKANAL